MSAARIGLLRGIVGAFALGDELETIEPYGTGHINDTFRSRWSRGGSSIRYIHQRINESVFARPEDVMENIVRVTRHIAGKLAEEGREDRERRVLSLVPTRSGAWFARDGEGGYWRTYLFIEGALSRETADSPAQARVLGAEIGLFQKALSDLGGPRLRETIPGFHDMERRYEAFDRALAADAAGRAGESAPEIGFMRENRARGAVLVRALREGRIPERICHNDTKMNNILLDARSGRALCVTDLDTVMPGTPLYDLGDLVRTVAARAREDERDLSKAGFDPVLFESLLDGYLSEASSFLERRETELIAEAGRTITQIMALRFLTDHLAGDKYYRITRAGQNLDRCRTQIALIRSMDAGREAIDRVVAKILERYAPVGRT